MNTRNLPVWLVSYVVDPLERAARTFAQQMFVILVPAGAMGALLGQNWLFAADSAGLAAVVSILTSVLTFKVPVLPVWADVALRVGKTGLQSFLGTLTAGHLLGLSHVDWKASLAVAYAAAFAALVTSLAAIGVPTSQGASLLPYNLADASQAKHAA